MKKVLAGISLILIFSVSSFSASRPSVSASDAFSAFRFVLWSDTKTGLGKLSRLSSQVEAMNPVMTIYPGDLCESGATRQCLDDWKESINGRSNNGLSHMTFALRGNHDATNTGTWQSYFNFMAVAESVGATHFSDCRENLTYSFDYRNSHFVLIDMPDGEASSMDFSTIDWLDADLTAAESRGLVHAFLAFHGPIYYVDGHPDTVSGRLIAVLNSHPIVSATLHGHEHVLAYVHIDATRITNVTHPFEEFVSGGAGAELHACASSRSDWCQSTFGFFLVTVSGASYTVEAYALGGNTPLMSWTFK
jgi:3',5'-cyclic AMP phosphodiesterase CpdA